METKTKELNAKLETIIYVLAIANGTSSFTGKAVCVMDPVQICTIQLKMQAHWLYDNVQINAMRRKTSVKYLFINQDKRAHCGQLVVYIESILDLRVICR